jgi:hypothetical protein
MLFSLSENNIQDICLGICILLKKLSRGGRRAAVKVELRPSYQWKTEVASTFGR